MRNKTKRSSAVGVSPEARSGAGLEVLTPTAERSGTEAKARVRLRDQ